MLEVSQSFYFEAAHTLHRDVDTCSSKRIHGHTYHAEITVRGEADHNTGMLIDVGILKAVISKLRGQLDHHFLDEISDLGIPTIENLCLYIWKEIHPLVPNLWAVRVWRPEGGDSCRYQPN